MALFTRTSRTEGVSDPAKLLINDHMKVERIFEEIKSADSPDRRKSLVSQLDAELTRHTTIEENVLYPFMEEHLPDGEQLIGEAEKEHEEATKLLERASHVDPSSTEFMPGIEELETAVSHHVREEERELFPKLEQSTDEPTLAKLRVQLENEKLGMSPRPNLPSNEVRGGRAKEGATSTRSGTSSGKANVWVQPHGKDDRWQVKREGAKRASRTFDTQNEAAEFGRNLAKRERVELIVAGRDGQVRDRSSFGNDPARSSG
jgi:hemerythrin superfamily protein